MTENNNFLERDQGQVGVGQWSLIEKTEWQQLNNDAWRLPTVEQGIISLSRGAMVAMGAGVVVGGFLAIGNSLAGFDLITPWVAVPVGLVAGIGYALYDFQGAIADTFQLYRERMTRQEVYQRETKAASATSQERIVIESHEKHGASVHTVYDELAVSAEILSKVTMLRELSTRTLQEAGVPSNTALQLMDNLTKFGFVVREKTNKPAVWTSKGQALVHHFNPQYALECNDN